MAKVFLPPACIPVPELDFSDIKKYNQECLEFKNKLKEFILSISTQMSTLFKYYLEYSIILFIFVLINY